MPPLPEASEHEQILTAPDGSCFGQEKVDCPRNKSCAAPEVRPVLCPK
jgi:hypothetical protein